MSQYNDGFYIKKHLSNIWSSIHDKVKQHWGLVEKKVLLIKKACNALKRLLISFIKVAKERFIKHFGYDKNNFVEDNFGL